ncbi:DNA-binding transcriptional regulator [bacterium]|nr:MAG: DNA-binding transcriptional regulator [bacterium]
MKGENASRQANVALIVETSVVYGREILKGISRHRAVHGGWSVFLDERELDAPAPEWLLDWEGDGVILRSTTPELAEGLRSRGLAVVDLNDRHGDLGLPRIASDMRAIGRLAAEHLLKRGYKSLAYCGFEGEAWCDARLAGVLECAEPYAVFRTPWRGLREHAWQEERDAIGTWLSSLPKPLGVVACNDVRGHHVLDACRLSGLDVPEEVAVIGVDNAETFCALCDPPLSSVVPDAARIGHEAAALLDCLMRGEDVPKGTTLVPPKGVVTRQSTDSVAIADPLVARSVRFIRENAQCPIGVDDVLARTGVSRSTLERRFRAALGRSPHDEIGQARLKRVKTLLRETDWPLARIAEETGFDHPEYMMVQFKRETGQTPSQWRTVER